MTRSARITWLLFLAFGLLARSESLSTSGASTLTTSLSTLPTSAPTSATTRSSVAQPQTLLQSKPTTEAKEFDPFEVIGGNDNGDGNNVPKPPSTDSNTVSKTAANSATSATTSKQATETARSATGSDTFTSVVQTSATQSTAEASAATTPTASQSIPASATDAHLAKATQSGTSQSSGASSYSWKTLGIGVLAFVGVVIIILCSAFSDSILRTIRSPFKKRDEEDEVLVPDWRRGSWRMGMEDPDGPGRYPEKNTTHFVVEDYSGFGDQEKSVGMKMNGGPVNPFPRRTPSVRTGVARSPGLEAGEANVRSVRAQAAGGYSVFPSPPPLAHTFTSVRGDGECDPFTDTHAATHSVAYGGME